MLTNFTRVRELFDRAISLEPDSRDAWARNACQDDTALLAELREMLRAAEQDSLLQNKVTNAEPEFIGAYRVLREIGRGGMGVVYLAMRDDGTFRKNVALKVLSGDRVSPEFVLRFRQERQVMAALDHPNIARILDGGDTPDQMPWYVMEYVEGLPIDKYCDEQRLSVTGRIGIFQQVCRAVEYLHQNSVLHRDLKPTNILISAEGVVKLLDFGVAKLVGAAAVSAGDLTSIQGRPMTPIYASPEQISGANLAKNSDVYSLGVILYRLLTGRTPWENLDEKVAKLAARDDPSPPSANIREDLRAKPENTAQLRRAMLGELDSIVLMAMRHDPKRRYQTAAELAEDLARFLEGHTVVAHHDSVAVRSVKLLKRKRMVVAVLAGFIVVASLGLWQFQRVVAVREAAASREARLQALIGGLEARMRSSVGEPGPQVVRERIEDVRSLKKAFGTDFTAAAARHSGHAAELDALLERGIQYLDRVRTATPSDSELIAEVSGAYEELGLLEEKSPYANSANRQAALRTYEKSAALMETMARDRPEDSASRGRLTALNKRIKDLGGIPVLILTNTKVTSEPSVSAPPRKFRAGTTPVRREDRLAETSSPIPGQNEPQPETEAPAAAVSPGAIEEYRRTSSDVSRADDAIDGYRRDLSSNGEVLNADISWEIRSMHEYLSWAKRDLDAGNEAAAAAELRSAKELASKVRRRVNR
jgi:eukaryotic-like serine/threonine-protein kinase